MFSVLSRSIRNNRVLAQQDGWETQDGRMTKKMSRKIGKVEFRATFFRHSAVLSLPAVLLPKLPNIMNSRTLV